MKFLLGKVPQSFLLLLFALALPLRLCAQEQSVLLTISYDNPALNGSRGPSLPPHFLGLKYEDEPARWRITTAGRAFCVETEVPAEPPDPDEDMPF